MEEHNKYYCIECKEVLPVGCGPCQNCCEHEFDPDEGYMCLNCGKEGFEDLVSAAEYLYEDR